MNIYVGNLAKDVNQDDLRAAFGEYGAVNSIKIIIDHVSGESKGFGFVDMPSRVEAEYAIKKLDGAELKGQIIKVGEARRRKESLPLTGVRGGKLTRGGGRKF